MAAPWLGPGLILHAGGWVHGAAVGTAMVSSANIIGVERTAVGHYTVTMAESIGRTEMLVLGLPINQAGGHATRELIHEQIPAATEVSQLLFNMHDELGADADDDFFFGVFRLSV